jgi:hypothetical protein
VVRVRRSRKRNRALFVHTRDAEFPMPDGRHTPLFPNFKMAEAKSDEMRRNALDDIAKR